MYVNCRLYSFLRKCSYKFSLFSIFLMILVRNGTGNEILCLFRIVLSIFNKKLTLKILKKYFQIFVRG